MNHIYLIYEFRFWVQGVLLTIVGTIGLIGNTASIIVLSQSGMKNTFNQLLIWLAAFDSTFIIFAIVRCAIFDAFWWRWWRYQFVRTLYIYSFPYFIHPLTSISFMASIFTTVALSYERHKALCNPIQHRHARAKYSVKRRTLSYAIPILLMTIPHHCTHSLTFTKSTSLA